MRSCGRRPGLAEPLNWALAKISDSLLRLRLAAVLAALAETDPD